MLPTVKERRKNASFFHLCYTDLCKLRNLMPHPGTKAQAGRNVLDFYGDRVKIDEWAPILEALKHDRSLHFIAFRCRHPTKRALEDIDTEGKARAVTKRPVLLTNFILRLLMESLAACVAVSTAVTCLELEGLPLGLKYISLLCRGLSTNTSLQTISLHHSTIGDEGCKQLCFVVRNLPTLIHLDLSNCDLGDESAISIAELLKYQTLQRFSESWKQSLRYREPDIEAMPGLRRIILNNNTSIGNEGVKHLTEVLKEDIWLRAVDLQNCGIGNEGALNVIEMLKINATLCIIDLRENKAVDEILIHQIMAKLYCNNANKHGHEYHWTIPDSHLVGASSSQSLRSRRSILTAKPVAVKSNQNGLYRPLVQRCKSLCSGKKVAINSRKCFGVPWKADFRMQTIPGVPEINSCNALSIHQGQVISHLQTTSESRLAQLQETRLKLKYVTEQLERETSLRKRAESRHEELHLKVQELENELRKEKKTKEGYCLLKLEAYEAVLDTFRKFSAFMENVKEANAVEILQKKSCQGMWSIDSECQSDMKKSHSAHVKSNMVRTELSKVSKSLSGLQPEITDPANIEKEIGDYYKVSDSAALKNYLLGADSIKIHAENGKVSNPLRGVNINGCHETRICRSEEQINSSCSASSQQDHVSLMISKSDKYVVPNDNLPVNSSLNKVQRLFESLIKDGPNVEQQGKVGQVTNTKDIKETYLNGTTAKPLEKPFVSLNHQNLILRRKNKFTKSVGTLRRDHSLEEETELSKSWSPIYNVPRLNPYPPEDIY